MKTRRNFYLIFTLFLGIFSGFFLFVTLSSNGWYVTWPFFNQGVYSALKFGSSSADAVLLFDKARDDGARSQAIFAVFASSVKFGTTAQIFSDIFSDKSWVDSSDVKIVTVEGGRSVIQGGSNCSHVAIALYSKNGIRQWNIHLCLEGIDGEQGAINFLKNSGPSKFSKIKNFTLVQPWGVGRLRIEEFYWWGMRLEYSP